MRPQPYQLRRNGITSRIQATAPVKLPTSYCPHIPDSRNEVRSKKEPGWYLTGGPTCVGPPTYAEQVYL